MYGPTSDTPGGQRAPDFCTAFSRSFGQKLYRRPRKLRYAEVDRTYAWLMLYRSQRRLAGWIR